jgi:uncharacterized protein YkwD
MKRLLLTFLLIFGVLLCSCSASVTTQSSAPATVSTTTTTVNATTTTLVTTASTTTSATTSTTVVPVTTTVKPTTTGTSTVFPTAIYIPQAAPYKPAGAELDLFQYALSLINNDRQTAGLPPVTLSYNAAAETHARDMFNNYYGGHWGTDGLKPYMRYTDAGGLNQDAENSAYSGWLNPSDNSDNYQSINVRDEIANLEHIMVYDDAKANWGHRDTILNKAYTTVNLGIVYDGKRVALVQQFEVKYLDYYSAPAINNGNLVLLGKLTSTDIKLNNISISYDPPPQTLTNAQLTTEVAYSDGYSLGDRLNFIVSPPPAGQSYVNLSPLAIIADKWEVNDAGQFSIQANINASLSKGKGVYTIVIVAIINGASANLTNYSIVIK